MDSRKNATEDPATIADLEPYGLSLRTINQLENYCGFIYVDDLVGVTESQLQRAWYFGTAAIAELRAALRNFLEERVVNSEEDCIGFSKSRMDKIKGGLKDPWRANADRGVDD